MINSIIHSCISVIHPVINQGVPFMNIYHDYIIVFLYEEKTGLRSQQVNYVFPCSNPIISNILLFYLIDYCN